MKQRLFFCADLGTSSLKAALIDTAGSLHGFTRISYTIADSADSWLTAFYEAVERLAAALNGKKLCPVSAVVVSGSGPTLAPALGEDSSSETLRPLYWYNALAQNAAASAKEQTPLKKCASLFLPRVKAFMDAFPADFAKTRYFFSPQEWLLWKLGARPVTVLPHSGFEPYYWDDNQCGESGIDRDRFPPFVIMGSVIGELSPNALSKTAAKHSVITRLLPPGIPLVAGASDFIMALIGTETLEPGKVCDRTGSSEGINLCVTQETAARYSAKTETCPVGSGELRILPHAMEGLWNMGVVIPKSGMLFEEYRKLNCYEKKSYAELTAEILCDTSHSGRSILESMGRAFSVALDNLECAGFAIKELVLSGGQCSDPLWNQYKADISGRILNVPEVVHAELAGNAIIAAALEGGSIREWAARMIRIKETFVPK